MRIARYSLIYHPFGTSTAFPGANTLPALAIHSQDDVCEAFSARLLSPCAIWLRQSRAFLAGDNVSLYDSELRTRGQGVFGLVFAFEKHLAPRSKIFAAVSY